MKLFNFQFETVQVILVYYGFELIVVKPKSIKKIISINNIKTAFRLSGFHIIDYT